jgi:hypothetical protein
MLATNRRTGEPQEFQSLKSVAKSGAPTMPSPSRSAEQDSPHGPQSPSSVARSGAPIAPSPVRSEGHAGADGQSLQSFEIRLRRPKVLSDGSPAVDPRGIPTP